VTETQAAGSKKRTYVSQADVPRVSLPQALRVPRALADHYGKKPARPLDIAAALEMSPTSGSFRDLCGAAIGYGLTEGGPNASAISLTQLGQRIVAPLEEGEDHRSLRAAALIPTVEKNFLEKYDGSPLPAEKIGCNVLETMSVPADAAQRVLNLIIENARSVGFLKVIKDKTYVDLENAARIAPPADASVSDGSSLPSDEFDGDLHGDEKTAPPTPAPSSLGSVRNRRVFVSHGKSRRVVDQLKELLTFGDFEPVVSVEREAVSKPVPQKVLDDMRSCGAGIIHVKPEDRLLDSEGTERRILNQNVLIEIGAAMALYGEHFILLVEDGTTLPSNLQGLYEVRYSGDELGYEATMKVLKALNQFKSTRADD
jgi:predicted nucleotide-binding protein